MFFFFSVNVCNDIIINKNNNDTDESYIDNKNNNINQKFNELSNNNNVEICNNKITTNNNNLNEVELNNINNSLKMNQSPITISIEEECFGSNSITSSISLSSIELSLPFDKTSNESSIIKFNKLKNNLNITNNNSLLMKISNNYNLFIDSQLNNCLCGTINRFIFSYYFLLYIYIFFFLFLLNFNLSILSFKKKSAKTFFYINIFIIFIIKNERKSF